MKLFYIEIENLKLDDIENSYGNVASILMLNLFIVLVAIVPFS